MNAMLYVRVEHLRKELNAARAELINSLHVGERVLLAGTIVMIELDAEVEAPIKIELDAPAVKDFWCPIQYLISPKEEMK